MHNVETSAFIPAAILWHVTELEKPKESGNYLVMFKSGYVRDLAYSARHQAFNVCDLGKADHAIPCEGILAWADAKAMIKEVGDNARNAVMEKEAARYGI